MYMDNISINLSSSNNTFRNSSILNNRSKSSINLTSYYEYVIIGLMAILSNLIILFVLFRNKKYLVKCAMITGLAFGDFLDGVALLGNGARRIYMIADKTMVHPSFCMSTFTPVFLMGNQIPGAMFFLIGVERILAVYQFDWYYAKWTYRLAWMCTSFAYMFCTVSLGVAFLVTYFQHSNATIPITCNTPLVMGKEYIIFNYFITIVGGTVAGVGTIAAMIMFTKRKNRATGSSSESNNPMRTYFKKQCSQTRLMLCISILDLGLVVLPNILLTLENGFNVVSNADLPTWSLQIISLRSVLNIFIYFIVNPEFRRSTFIAFGMKPKTNFVNSLLRQRGGTTAF